MSFLGQPAVLYRFFDRDGVLLYIGVTTDLYKRLRSHRRDKPWFHEVWELRTEPAGPYMYAHRLELHAINTEGARYNVTPKDAAIRGHKPMAWRKTWAHERGLRCPDRRCDECPPVHGLWIPYKPIRRAA